MMIEPSPYDSADYLDTDASIRFYLDEAFESGDPTLISHALGTAARARGMAEVARKAGIPQESLCRAFGSEGRPEQDVVLGVIRALGLRKTTTPAA